MFLVRCESPVDDLWEERVGQLVVAAGRKSDLPACCVKDGDDKHWEHVWKCDTFGDARHLKKLLDAVGETTVTIREGMTG